jgi:putative ABC transport system permease protein
MLGRHPQEHASRTVRLPPTLLTALTRRVKMEGMDASMPGMANRSAIVMTLHDRWFGSARPALLVLFGAGAFLLLIACVNVASLLLARATSRQRELAVRAALGAGRWPLVRQLLWESLIIAALGGGLGLLMPLWAVPYFCTSAPPAWPAWAASTSTEPSWPSQPPCPCSPGCCSVSCRPSP